MESVDLNLSSGSLRAVLTGAPHGAAVICVPGLSANSRSFDAIAAELARRGRRVVALDLRGRGSSPATAPGTYGWARHARDVLEAAERLGLGALDLAGHSTGAFVSMQALALAPARVRKLVLVDAAGVPDVAAVPPILESVQRLGATYPSAEVYCERIQARGVVIPWDALWAAHSAYELEALPGGAVRPRTSKEAVVEDLLYGASHDPRALWAGLTVPTLLVRATRPLAPGGGLVVPAATQDAFAREVPTSALVEVDANHYGVMAHPDALRAIAAFLDDDPNG